MREKVFSLNIFIYSGLGNKLLQLILNLFHFMGVSAALWHYPAFFLQIYKGVFYVQEILVSLNTVQPSPSDRLSSLNKTIFANGVEKEPKIQSLKFSPRS